MAKMIYDPKVGDILYPSYSPQQVFKVTKVDKVEISRQLWAGSDWHTYKSWKVEGITAAGKTVTFEAGCFASYEELRDSHVRKAEKFTKIIDKLKAL